MGPAVREKTALVVDDEPDIRKYVRVVLLRQGYEVLEAEDGLTAYELLQRCSGDVQILVTDVRMPGMDGITLGRKVSMDFPRVEVLYMSGFVSDPPEHDIPGNHFLPKPFAPKALVECLRSLGA